MNQIKIVDTQFAHGTSLGSGDLKLFPKYFEWYRGKENINDMVVITEDSFHLVDNLTEKIKIAWITEPPSINQGSYKWLIENEDKFAFILSHQYWLQDTFVNKDKFRWVPYGGCWIYPDQRKIHQKSKNISIIASGKTQTVGQRLRHEVIDRYKDKIDGIFGRGYQFVENKIEALRDYRYSIVIENEASSLFFTEKLIDCLVTGTMPIYYGPSNIHTKFYIPKMFRFGNAEQLDKCLINATEENYGKCISSVQLNFRAAKEFVCPEDWMWNNFFVNSYLFQ